MDTDQLGQAALPAAVIALGLSSVTTRRRKASSSSTEIPSLYATKRGSIRAAAPKNENYSSQSQSIISSDNSSPQSSNATDDVEATSSSSASSSRLLTTVVGWSDICSQWQRFEATLSDRVSIPGMLLCVAAVTFSMAWFMMFSWTSLIIQTLIMMSLVCVVASIYASCRVNGLLTFAPAGIRRMFTDLSLMDIARIPWNSRLITDIATLFVFRLSDDERNQILQQLPAHISRTLQTKGLVNLLPPTIKPLVVPHPPLSTPSAANDVYTPSSPPFSSSLPSHNDDLSSPATWSNTNESKRGFIDRDDQASSTPLLSLISPATGCPITRARTVWTPSSSSSVLSPLSTSTSDSTDITNFDSPHDNDSLFMRQFRAWSVDQVGNKRLHALIGRVMNSRLATSMRQAAIPHIMDGTKSVLPSRRTVAILAGTGACTMAIQYALSPGTRRWTRRWTAFGMESSLYIAVTIALAGFIATRGFSDSTPSSPSSLTSPSCSYHTSLLPSPSSARGIRGAILRALRFERRHHKMLLSMAAIAGWLGYLARAYKARTRYNEQVRLARELLVD